MRLVLSRGLPAVVTAYVGLILAMSSLTYRFIETAARRYARRVTPRRA